MTLPANGLPSGFRSGGCFRGCFLLFREDGVSWPADGMSWQVMDIFGCSILEDSDQCVVWMGDHE